MTWFERLIKMKKSSGKTTEEIAKLTHVPKSTLDKLFAGKTKDPQISTISAVVYSLGYTMNDLLEGDEANAVILPKAQSPYLQKYQELSPTGQKTILDLISSLYEIERSLVETAKIIDFTAPERPAILKAQEPSEDE